MKEYTLKPSTGLNRNTPVPLDLSELNDAQRDAVLATEGPVLVIAGAGSGKTKTLVFRLANIVNQGVRPEAILLLTFTKKSSQEMLRRASTVLDHRCEQVSGGTFHSFANVVLRYYGHAIGYGPGFTILDRSDADELVGMIRSEIGSSKADKRFPKKSTIGSMISMSVNTDRHIDAVISSEYPQFLDYSDDIQKIALAYQAKKESMQVMDYDDLLVKLAVLLQEHPAIRAELQATYDYIMVDEYQDTNRLQADIIRRLANDRHNVMVVGDDAQSIYSFRGASFKNIIEFPDLFPNTRIITLEQNYRSSQPILNLTNALISKAREKYAKTLFTQRPGGERPVYVEAADENTQSRFVAQKILELRENGISLNDIAVLVRSGWHSNDLEVELQARNIPFQKFGGFKFIETAHVKDVLSFLRVMQNPGDLVSWSRILQLLDGVGPKSVSQIMDTIPVLRKTRQLPSALSGKKFSTSLGALIQLVLRDVRSMLPQDLLEAALLFYIPIFRLKFDDHAKRLSDLESLRGIAARYKSLDTFMSEISLEPPDQSQADSLPGINDDERITISTIHSAKGLEWRAVFLISAVDGYIPSFQSLGDLGQLEEERRLLYVALTRAKDELYIVKPNLDAAAGHFQRYPGVTFSRLTRFLDEYQVLDDLAEKWVLRDETPKKFGLGRRRPHEDLPPPDPNRKKYFF
jgi:DNA helicase-2/ATP-dependent DNA helicase PcrA